MHFVAVKFEVVLKDVQAAFPHFAEHPSHGFVDEVVGMVEQKVSDAQGVSIFVVAAEHPVGDQCPRIFGHDMSTRSQLLARWACCR